MKRGIFAGMGMTFALGGCILIDTYQSDTYKPQETSSTSSSSGTGSTSGVGGGAGQGGNGGMGGMAGMGGMGGAMEPPGTVEICGNSIDEDGMAGIGGMGGVGTVEAVCPQNKATWNARFGDNEMQRARRVTISGNDDIIIAGEYDGTVNIGSPTNFLVEDDTNAGNYQPFVARFGPDGTAKWIIKDGAFIGTARDVTTHTANLPKVVEDTYWTGVHVDHASVIKITTEPPSTWSTTAFDNAPGSRGAAIEVATLGGMLYVAGTVMGTGSFDCVMPPPAYTGITTPTLFLAAIKPADGTCAWAEIYPGADIDPESVTMKFYGGNPIIAGTYRKAIEGTTWPNVSGGNSGVFFLQTDAKTGTITNSRGYATADIGEINVRRMQVMSVMGGNVFVTGSFRGKFDTNLDAAKEPASTSADTALDAFVMSVDVTKNFDVQWINRFGGPNIQEGTGLAALSGNIYATGITYGPMSPDPATTLGQMCPPNEGKCMYWMRMSGNDGKVAWAESIGTKDAAANSTIDVAFNGKNVVLAGGWSLLLNFGDMMNKAPKGNLDIFLASYTAASLP